MHILIGIITAIAGLLWALNSLQNAGVNLNALNPFAWLRRRNWQKQLGTKPMHGLTDSMEAAALLVVAIAKQNGDITRETKLEILSLFEKEFGIKRGRAIELYSSSTYLLQGTLNMADEVRHILAPSKEQFNQAHQNKLIDMLNVVSELEGTTQEQRNMIKAVELAFGKDQEPAKNW